MTVRKDIMSDIEYKIMLSYDKIFYSYDDRFSVAVVDYSTFKELVDNKGGVVTTSEVKYFNISTLYIRLFSSNAEGYPESDSVSMFEIVKFDDNTFDYTIKLID